MSPCTTCGSRSTPIPKSPWQKKPNALTIKNARALSLQDVSIDWAAPVSDHWLSALLVDNVQGLTLDDVSVGPAPNGNAAPAVVLTNVDGAVITHSRAHAGTGTFLQLTGATRDVVLWANDLRHAGTPVAQAPEVAADVVTEGWS